MDENNRKLYVDHREHANNLKSELTSFGFEIVEKQLALGDYIIAPDTTIERKTTDDFKLSILDGRLFNQAYRLSRFCENPIIIIEGKSFKKNSGVAIKMESVKGALITLAQTFRIPVIRTTDESDTAWYINQMAYQRTRIGSNKGPITAHKPKKVETRKEYILKAFPGIGPKTAKALLEEFGSITNIINASEKDLKKVYGMGPKTVERVFDVVREEPAVYISQGEI